MRGGVIIYHDTSRCSATCLQKKRAQFEQKETYTTEQNCGGYGKNVFSLGDSEGRKKKFKNVKKQAQHRAAPGRSRHKSHGEIQHYGSFPHTMPKMDFHYSHRFS